MARPRYTKPPVTQMFWLWPCDTTGGRGDAAHVPGAELEHDVVSLRVAAARGAHGVDDRAAVVPEDLLLGGEEVVLGHVGRDLVVELETALIVEEQGRQRLLAGGLGEAGDDLVVDVAALGLGVLDVVRDADVEDVDRVGLDVVRERGHSAERGVRRRQQRWRCVS